MKKTIPQKTNPDPPSIVEFVDGEQIQHLIGSRIEVKTNKDEYIEGKLTTIEITDEIGYIILDKVTYNNKYIEIYKIPLTHVVTLSPHEPFLKAKGWKKSPQHNQSMVETGSKDNSMPSQKTSMSDGEIDNTPKHNSSQP